MANFIQELEWDTQNFFYKVGRVNAEIYEAAKLDQVLQEAKERRFKLLYYSVNWKNKLALEFAYEMGLKCYDEKTTFVRPVFDENLRVESSIISYSHKSLNDSVLKLAYQAGEYSRFKLDPHFEGDEFKKLYRIWIENSLSQEIAQEVLVSVSPTGKEAGLITLGTKNGRGDIGLIAVSDEFRGKGIGKQLMNSAMAFFLKKGFGQVQVLTQKQNLGACKFYEACGFSIESIENVFHIWL